MIRWAVSPIPVSSLSKICIHVANGGEFHTIPAISVNRHQDVDR
jgi:hypothetical protein